MSKEVNKSELAKAIGKSSATITKLAKEGVLNQCFTPTGQINLTKALEAISKSKGKFFIDPKDTKKEKSLQEMTQLEVIELVEREKNIKFTMKGNELLMSAEKLKDGSFYLYAPKVLTPIEDIREHLKENFTDKEIEQAISEVDNEGRSNFLYELLYEIMRDKTMQINLNFIYKKMLSAFYSASEIAFYMECMRDDGKNK